MKSQVEFVFQFFMNIAKRQFLISLKEVQIDGGKEFIFSQVNDMMECKYQRVMEKGLALILQVSLPTTMWVHAF